MADAGLDWVDGRIIKWRSSTEECEKLAKEGRLQEVIENLCVFRKTELHCL
jgi:hypothetical protein